MKNYFSSLGYKIQVHFTDEPEVFTKKSEEVEFKERHYFYGVCVIMCDSEILLELNSRITYCDLVKFTRVFCFLILDKNPVDHFQLNTNVQYMLDNLLLIIEEK